MLSTVLYNTTLNYIDKLPSLGVYNTHLSILHCNNVIVKSRLLEI